MIWTCPTSHISSMLPCAPTPRPFPVPQMSHDPSCHRALAFTLPSAWNWLPPTSLPK